MTAGILVDVGSDTPEIEQYGMRQMNAWCRANLAGMIFDSAAVAACAVPFDTLDVTGGGIYFLVREGQITYVGQSRNLRDRIYQHACAGRQFDGACVIGGVPSWIRDVVEYAYIMAWTPPENGKRLHCHGCPESDGFAELIAKTDDSRVARPALEVVAAAGY